MVCFISVFTHLMQEESFLYLREAQRVVKQGGRILASYLDINAPEHWKIFEANVNSAEARQSKPMDIFLCRDFLKVWAEKARSGDSSRRTAWSRPATLRFAQAMILIARCGKTTVGRAP